MWQRIQTVFLAIVIISLVTSIFFPIWFFNAPSGITHVLYPLHYTHTENGPDGLAPVVTYFPYSVTAMLMIAAITIAIIQIRKYKNRMVQMKLGALNSLFMAGAIASAVLFSNQFIKQFHGGNYGLGLWLPGVAVICNLLANRYIRKDEKLVRDSGRLR